MATPPPRLSELNGKVSHNLVAYKWNVKLFPNSGGTNDTPPLVGIFLFRYTIFPEGSQETKVLPLKSHEIQNFQNTTSMIHSIFQQFPDLSSYEDLERAMAVKVACKFRFRPEFFEREDREHALILFLDLKIDRRMESLLESDDDGLLRIENYARELEEYLKMCPKIKIRAEEPKKMEAIKHAVLFIKLGRIKEIGRSEDEVCSICLRGLYESKFSARTCCGHMFHDICIAKWLVRSNALSCPVCRFSFYVNI